MNTGDTMNNNGHEEWRSIPGFSDRYQVSNMGRIRSSAKGDWKILTGAAVRVSPRWNRKYHYYIIDGRSVIAHRVVWESFIGPLGDMLVTHRNGDTLDNRLSNLEAITEREKGRRRAESYNSKITEDDARLVCSMLDGTKSRLDVSKETGIAMTAIRKILSGEVHTHIVGEIGFKERNMSGKNSPIAQWKESDILEMKRLYSSGEMTQKEIAEHYDTHFTFVSHVMTGRRWSDVGPSPVPKPIRKPTKIGDSGIRAAHDLDRLGVRRGVIAENTQETTP